jgi:hypothetical protein
LIGDDFGREAISCQDLARAIFDFLNVYLVKVAILRMLEHKSVIRFFLKDGLAAMEIPGRLSQEYRDRRHEEGAGILLDSGDSDQA